MRPFLPITLALLASAACGTEVAQTAYSPGSDPFLCSAAPDSVPLPSDPRWSPADGSEPNPLVLTSYAAGEGPGIYAVARDGFRLYLNGRLLAISSQPRQPVFVPATLLPGDNVVVLVVTASAGAAMGMVQVDELERTYASSTTWRVSAEPLGDFTAVDYDDSGWPSAVDHGPAGERPGCDPASVFPSDSPAHWIGGSLPRASTLALRFKLRIEPVGFGAQTTGGSRVEPVRVADCAELRTMVEASDEPRTFLLPEGLIDCRLTAADAVEVVTCPVACDAGATGDGKVQYQVTTADTPCARNTVSMPQSERRIAIGSNQTLVGLGRGAQLRGAALQISGTNVILRNLAVYDVDPSMTMAGDGIELSSATNVWIDHCTLKWVGNRLLDLGYGSRGVTASWVRHDGWSEFSCSGRHLGATIASASEATFHHCWWDNVDTSAPLVYWPGARVHVFDSLISNNAWFGVGAWCGAQVLVEGNYFENVQYPTAKGAAWLDCTEIALGAIRAPAGSNYYGAGVGQHIVNSVAAAEPNDVVFSPPYPYQPEPAEGIRELVSRWAGAGSRWALPLSRD